MVPVSGACNVVPANALLCRAGAWLASRPRAFAPAAVLRGHSLSLPAATEYRSLRVTWMRFVCALLARWPFAWQLDVPNCREARVNSLLKLKQAVRRPVHCSLSSRDWLPTDARRHLLKATLKAPLERNSSLLLSSLFFPCDAPRFLALVSFSCLQHRTLVVRSHLAQRALLLAASERAAVPLCKSVFE